jgi:hypothetical protein
VLLSGLQEYFRDVEEAKLFQRVANLVNAEKLMVEVQAKISDLQLGINQTSEAYSDASNELSTVLQAILSGQQKLDASLTPLITKLTKNLDHEEKVLGLIEQELTK